MKILVGIIIVALITTVVALGVALGKVREKYRVARYVIDTFGDMLF